MAELFEVYTENWPSLQFFVRMLTQWRWSGGMAPQRVGFDYGAVDYPFVAAGIKKKDRVRVFSDLQRMEHAVIEEWQAQQK